MSKRKRTPQTKKFRGVANPGMAEAFRDLRRSSAASPHGAFKTERDEWRKQKQRGRFDF